MAEAGGAIWIVGVRTTFDFEALLLGHYYARHRRSRQLRLRLWCVGEEAQALPQLDKIAPIGAIPPAPTVSGA